MTASSKVFIRFTLLILLSVSMYTVMLNDAHATEYIGFASMERPVVKDPMMKIRLRELTNILYTLKYSSFQQVATSSQLTGLKPRTLEVRYDGGKRAKLNPSSQNVKAIAYFHEEFNGRFEDFLLEVCAFNDARALVFDRSDDPETLEIKRFGKDPDAVLTITLFAFYRDSGTLEVDFVDVNKSMMVNLPRLKTEIQTKVVSVAEKVIGNQAALAGAGAQAFGDKDDAVAGETVVAAPAASEW